LNAFDVEVRERDVDAFVVLTIEQVMALRIERIATGEVRRCKCTVRCTRTPKRKRTDCK